MTIWGPDPSVSKGERLFLADQAGPARIQMNSRFEKMNSDFQFSNHSQLKLESPSHAGVLHY